MDSLTPDDGSPLLSLPFDHYERYALTERLVGLLWLRRRGGSPLRILDVGGHSSPLKHFLPNDTVMLTDIKPPGSLTNVPLCYDAYFRAIGSQLPLADRTLDLVTAHDTLEHVPDGERPAFVRGLLRVSRRFVILNGPTYHPEIALAERRFARFLERALSTKIPSLEEHLELGLPEKEDIENVLHEHQLPFIRIPNGNLMLWLATNAVKGYISALPHPDRSSDVMDRIYNLLLSPQDFGGLCYREAYVIAKNRQDARTLERVRATLASQPNRSRVPDNVQALQAVLTGLADHAIQVRRDIDALQTTAAGLQNGLQQRDALLVEKDTLLAQKDAALDHKEAALTEKDSHIANIEAALHHANVEAASSIHQLEQVRNSVGYRLLERVRRPIRWLFPPGSWRSVPFRALLRPVKWLLKQR